MWVLSVYGYCLLAKHYTNNSLLRNAYIYARLPFKKIRLQVLYNTVNVGKPTESRIFVVGLMTFKKFSMNRDCLLSNNIDEVA